MEQEKAIKAPSRKKVLMKRRILNLVPIIGLLVLIAVYLGVGYWEDIRFDKGFQAILNSSVVCAVVATGAIFIYTLGSFDISLGAATLVSAMIGAMAYNATGSIVVMMLVCVLVAIGIELISSLLAAFLDLPVFITTVAMMSILNAFALVLIQINGTGDSISIPSEAVDPFDNMAFKLIVLILYLAFAAFMFNYTKIGRFQKFLGGNPLCAKLTGISMKKMAIVAFVLCGVGIGLGAILTVTYAPTVSRNTASGVGMNVILAIVFGGMPVSGGAKSKISAAVIGAISISVLDQIMSILQLGSGIGQMVKAVIFLAVVVLTSLGYRQKMLAR
ncbi:MAG: inner-membrane translocator [Clostridiales bacterium]|nr:inner-membrane translocator [Clostridiales bacterium]